MHRIVRSIQELEARRLITPEMVHALTKFQEFNRKNEALEKSWSCFVVGGVAACLHGQERATKDLDFRVTVLNDSVRQRIIAGGWTLFPSRTEAKSAIQFKAKIPNSIGSPVKVDGVLCPLKEFNTYNKYFLFNKIEGMTVAGPALIAIIKLQTIAMRGNTKKLGADCRDLMWALNLCIETKAHIPDEALQLGFVTPAGGWDSFKRRLWENTTPEEREIILRDLKKKILSLPDDFDKPPASYRG